MLARCACSTIEVNGSVLNCNYNTWQTQSEVRNIVAQTKFEKGFWEGGGGGGGLIPSNEALTETGAELVFRILWMLRMSSPGRGLSRTEYELSLD